MNNREKAAYIVYITGIPENYTSRGCKITITDFVEGLLDLGKFNADFKKVAKPSHLMAYRKKLGISGLNANKAVPILLERIGE